MQELERAPSLASPVVAVEMTAATAAAPPPILCPTRAASCCRPDCHIDCNTGGGCDGGGGSKE